MFSQKESMIRHVDDNGVIRQIIFLKKSTDTPHILIDTSPRSQKVLEKGLILEAGKLPVLIIPIQIHCLKRFGKF